MENAEYIHDLLSNFFKTKTFKAFLVVGILVLIIYNWGVFGTLKLDLMAVLFMTCCFFWAIGSRLFLDFKINSSKIIGDDNIIHSYRQNKIFMLRGGKYILFSKGGFFSNLGFAANGSDGVVMCPRNLLYSNENNFFCVGKTIKKDWFEVVNMSEKIEIKNFFGYCPLKIDYIISKNNDFALSKEKSKFYINDLIEENLGVRREIVRLQQIIKDSGITLNQQMTNSSSIINQLSNLVGSRKFRKAKDNLKEEERR